MINITSEGNLFTSFCTSVAGTAIDECLKHSSYTRVGSSFSRLFYRNFIVFVVRSLIFVSGVVAGTVE